MNEYCIECGHKLYHHRPFCCVNLCPCSIPKDMRNRNE